MHYLKQKRIFGSSIQDMYKCIYNNTSNGITDNEQYKSILWKCGVQSLYPVRKGAMYKSMTQTT